MTLVLAPSRGLKQDADGSGYRSGDASQGEGTRRLVVGDLPSVADAPSEKPHVLLGNRAEAHRRRREHLVPEGGGHPPRVILRVGNILEDLIDRLVDCSAAFYAHRLRLLPLMKGDLHTAMGRPAASMPSRNIALQRVCERRHEV